MNFKLDLKPGQEQQQQNHQLFLEHCNQTIGDHPTFSICRGGRGGLERANYSHKQQNKYNTKLIHVLRDHCT